MSPEELAHLHSAAFVQGRPWSAGELASLLASPAVFLIAVPAGFALGRIALDEVELLTLAVVPDAQRQGIGRALLDAFQHEACANGATTAFLEVAADNAAATRLYQNAGWAESGRRRGYYKRENAPAVDAVLMHKELAAAPIP